MTTDEDLENASKLVRASAKVAILKDLSENNVAEIIFWDGPSFKASTHNLFMNGDNVAMRAAFNAVVDLFEDFNYIQRG